MENIESITEEKEAKLPFYSYRSVLKCYSAGISFVTDNFLFILKTFSPVFACVALFFAIWMDLLYSFQPYFMVMSYLSLFLCGIFMYVIMAMTFRVFEQIASDKGFLGYNTLTLLKASRKKLVKMVHIYFINLASTIILLLPTIITGIVLYFYGAGEELTMESLGIKFIIFGGVLFVNVMFAGFAFGVPYYLAIYYVAMEKGSSLANLWKGLKVGYRMWAKCFGLELLLSVTFSLLGFVLGSVLSVMYSAKTVALMSAAQGDTVDMPEAMNWILPVVSFLTIFFACFLDIMAVSCGIYLYASAKTDEKNKENAIVFVDGESK